MFRMIEEHENAENKTRTEGQDPIPFFSASSATISFTSTIGVHTPLGGMLDFRRRLKGCSVLWNLHAIPSMHGDSHLNPVPVVALLTSLLLRFSAKE